MSFTTTVRSSGPTSRSPSRSSTCQSKLEPVEVRKKINKLQQAMQDASDLFEEDEVRRQAEAAERLQSLREEQLRAEELAQEERDRKEREREEQRGCSAKGHMRKVVAGRDTHARLGRSVEGAG